MSTSICMVYGPFSGSQGWIVQSAGTGPPGKRGRNEMRSTMNISGPISAQRIAERVGSETQRHAFV
jgi:hypothetical protein